MPVDRSTIARLTIYERKEYIDKIHINTPQFQAAFEKISEFHTPAKNGPPRGGALCTITGHSRAGKTYATTRYVKSVQRMDEMRAIHVAFPVDCTKRGLVDSIRRRVGMGVTQRLSNESSERQLIDTLQGRTEILVIDECDLITNRRVRQQDHITVFLRRLMDEANLTIIASGLPALDDWVMSHEQLMLRGLRPHFEARYYDWNNDDQRIDFEVVAQLIDDELPFPEPSNLTSPETLGRLYAISNGAEGVLIQFLRLATAAALNDEACRIERRHLSYAWEQIGIARIPTTYSQLDPAHPIQLEDKQKIPAFDSPEVSDRTFRKSSTGR